MSRSLAAPVPCAVTVTTSASSMTAAGTMSNGSLRASDRHDRQTPSGRMRTCALWPKSIEGRRASDGACELNRRRTQDPQPSAASRYESFLATAVSPHPRWSNSAKRACSWSSVSSPSLRARAQRKCRRARRRSRASIQRRVSPAQRRCSTPTGRVRPSMIRSSLRPNSCPQRAHFGVTSGSHHVGCVSLPVSWTREGDIKIAPPSSIVDPDATVRSRFIGHAAIAAARAAAGV